MITNKINDILLRDSFLNAKPFPHLVIDNFFDYNLANRLECEFPEFNDNKWYFYDNAIEHKKTLNHWDRFPKNTYQVFSYLNSPEFISQIEKLTSIDKLYPDIGLNGGGWHMHSRGGKLNVHLDYSIHPKLNLERRLNIIVYMNNNWKSEWGGQLGLWSHNQENNQPKECIKKVEPKFNRAVLFDTTCNSWHGLPETLQCPKGQYRKSLAIYYLSKPRDNASRRGKALFAPFGKQKQDDKILELIEKRSQVDSAQDVYKKK